MKSVPPHACLLQAARQGEKARHKRQVTVKYRIEAGDLGDIGKLLQRGLHEGDFQRQMIGRQRLDPVQRLK